MPNKTHSHEVHAILTDIPSWMVRYGITVFFFIIILLLGLAWLVKYPDIVTADIKLNAVEPPAVVVARATGNLELLIDDHESVAATDVFAYLKNAANYQDVLGLETVLQNDAPLQQLNEDWQLGELQPYFSQYLTYLKKEQNINRNVGAQNQQQRALLQQQISEYQTIIKQQEQQVKLLQIDYHNLQNAIRNRYQPLLTQGSISQQEYEQQLQRLRNKEQELELQRGRINETRSTIIRLQKEQRSIDFSHTNTGFENQNDLITAQSNLRQQLQSWKQKYVLHAPIAGQLSYSIFAQDNLFIEATTEVARIVPADSSEIFGAAFIPQMGAGKVEIGQTVYIQLDSYDKSEYGVLKGVVKEVSPNSTNGFYKTYIQLPTGLTTTAKRQLNYLYGMEGTAEIITHDLRLLERIFNEIRAAFQD